jgi:hypothetical protein
MLRPPHSTTGWKATILVIEHPTQKTDVQPEHKATHLFCNANSEVKDVRRSSISILSLGSKKVLALSGVAAMAPSASTTTPATT